MPKTPDITKPRRKPPNTKQLKKTKPSSVTTEEQKLKALAKEFCKPLPDEEQEELKESFQDEFGLNDLTDLDSREIWDAIEKSENYLVIEKASDLHKKGLSAVWKMYNFVTSSEENFLTLMPQVLKRAGIKTITGKFDPLNATFRSVIKTENRRVASRGAQAIRWAEHKKQTPDTLVDFKGGVDSWAKEWQTLSGIQRSVAGGNVKPKLKTTAAERVTELRKALKDGGGAVLLIKKDGKQLVTLGTFTLIKADKKTQWPKILKAFGKPSKA